ncbi:hypothetical protein [Yinghuangia soli]|uniref:Uncharacterized protein n=1 Tax=Yinghuangia soli TaxID=2908204 RepID=A0AA41PVM4_9ACTN|nr:hypothetical protein [Yinghuangia soli]MCF2526718.1 hypothetical protein [Yinghuangia soli]
MTAESAAYRPRRRGQEAREYTDSASAQATAGRGSGTHPGRGSGTELACAGGNPLPDCGRAEGSTSAR